MLMTRRTTPVSAVDEEVSPFLLTRQRTIEEVCRGLGQDDGGRKCPACNVLDLCGMQAKLASRAQHSVADKGGNPIDDLLRRADSAEHRGDLASARAWRDIANAAARLLRSRRASSSE